MYQVMHIEQNEKHDHNELGSDVRFRILGECAFIWKGQV